MGTCLKACRQEQSFIQVCPVINRIPGSQSENSIVPRLWATWGTLTPGGQWKKGKRKPWLFKFYWNFNFASILGKFCESSLPCEISGSIRVRVYLIDRVSLGISNCICIPYLIFNRVSKLQCYYLMIRISSVTKILSMIHLAFYALIFNVVINLYILYL